MNENNAPGPPPADPTSASTSVARIISACLWSPTRYLPMVRPALDGCLDVVSKKILDAIRPDDHDQVSLALFDRLNADPTWRKIATAPNEPIWLCNFEREGKRENEGTVRALVAQLLRERRRRVARAQLLRSAQHLEQPLPPEKLRHILATVESDAHKALAEENPGLPERFVDSARTLEEMRTNPVPVPESLLGEGLLRPGQLCLIHGPDGSRKSWAALHLAVALAARQSWFGIPTRPGGARVGLVSLEDDEPVLLSRLERVITAMHADPILVETNLVIVTAPHFIDPLDITDPSGQAALARLVSEYALQVLILDHLSRLHALPDERDLRPVSTPLIRLALTSAIAIPLLHHDRKAQGGSSRSGGADQGAARGDSRLTADARLIIGMKEAGKRIRLAVEKCTTGKKPAPIWLEHAESGALIKTDAPANSQEAAAANRSALLATIQEAGAAGVQRKDLTDKLRLSIKSVQRYANQLVEEGLVRKQGHTHMTRYFSTSTDEPPQTNATLF